MKSIKVWRQANERILHFQYPVRIAVTEWSQFPKKFWVDFGLVGLLYLVCLSVALQPWGAYENAVAFVKIFSSTVIIVLAFDLATVAVAKLINRKR